MNTQLRRALTGLVAGAVVVAGAALAAAPANAASIGTLAFSPAVGDSTSLTAYTASGACPAADTVKVTVVGGTGTGAVLATPKNIVGTQNQNLNAQGNNTVAAFQDWTTFAQINGLTNLNGTYNVAIACSSGSSFDGQLIFTGTALANATYTAVRTTSASLSPASQTIAYGNPATVTATVTVSDASIPTGSVKFTEGATTLGTVNLVNGSATLPASVLLTAGSHSINAAYTPDAAGTSNGYTASSAPTAATVTVTKVSPTVTLSDSTAGTGAQNSSTTLTATVNPNALAGSVQFFDGATSLGSAAVNTANGQASITWNIGATAATGAHSLSAVFSPTDTVNVVTTPAPTGTSTFNVTGATIFVTQGQGNVSVVLPPGTLSISTPLDSTLSVGNNTLSANGKYFIATGGLSPVIVSDNRAGDLGWNLKVSATDFVGTKGGTNFKNTANYNPRYPWQQNVINAANFGLVDSFVDPYGSSTSVNSGVAKDAVDAVHGLVPTTDPLLPNNSSTTGLGAPREIIFAQGGNGIGSATGQVQFSGHIQLNIPTVTVADTYSSVLTYTLTSN